MKLFEKQVILYEGKDSAKFLAYRDICQKNNIAFKVYDSAKVKGNCCGSMAGYNAQSTEHGYTIFVSAKDLEKVKALAKDVIPSGEPQN